MELIPSIENLLKPSRNLIDEIKKADVMLLWRSDLAKRLKKSHPKLTIFDVDDQSQPFSASNFLRAANHIIQNHGTPLQSVITHGFSSFLANNQKSRVLLLGTGPNLEQAYLKIQKFDVSIACNSIVKDKQALNAFKPQVIVAADPVFHVGASKYAEAFRNDLVRLFELNRSVEFVAPLHHKIIYDFIIPEKHLDRVSYLHVSPDSQRNLNLLESTSIRPTGNILTLLMLPIAATIASEIQFAGFDGNKRHPLFYFWKHNKQTQYHDLIHTAKTVDPVFFKRSFLSYYRNHQQELSTYLQIIHTKGISMKAITDTYIKCLNFYSNITNNNSHA